MVSEAFLRFFSTSVFLLLRGYKKTNQYFGTTSNDLVLKVQVMKDKQLNKLEDSLLIMD